MWALHRWLSFFLAATHITYYNFFYFKVRQTWLGEVVADSSMVKSTVLMGSFFPFTHGFSLFIKKLLYWNSGFCSQIANPLSQFIFLHWGSCRNFAAQCLVCFPQFVFVADILSSPVLSVSSHHFSCVLSQCCSRSVLVTSLTFWHLTISWYVHTGKIGKLNIMS